MNRHAPVVWAGAVLRGPGAGAAPTTTPESSMLDGDGAVVDRHHRTPTRSR